ncbi:hypothetical protein AKJ46_00115 [candidate division MSBL1 archaeon SCGC-AAA833K04]|uniref:Rho termination factor-like N-terminal domain-containing protein n=1 Tax=candidate division MSBL1 archaeon SCGC-AAA833K04 TaxID=1698258 RepID=A0A133VT25_9EURY|nr:hypothetical protein AKJ46_00115 [candidate division MSBL1 archaeon SCGC-AAA833K04]
MPTKRELLEEKTVKELKQMARDKDLSGYSGMRKAGLADLISAEYTKAEIESWPEVEEAKPAPEEEIEEEEAGEVVEEAKPVEVTRIEEKFGEAIEPAPEEELEEEKLPMGIIVGVGIVIIIIVIVVAALTLL